MPIRALVVEDDPFSRISVVAALQQYGYQVVVEEASASQALLRAKTARPDVAVLDLHLGAGPTGLDVAQALRRMNPRIGIVLLTSFEDPRLLSSGLPAVPRGTVYITKQSVTKMSQPKSAISESLVFDSNLARIPLNPAFGSLTNVQVETLKLVAEGLSNSEIAIQRSVSQKSIEQTIARVAKALGITPDSKSNQRVHIARVYFRSIGAKTDA
ncbi:CitB Response regulator containing a CheY-like receiver domain and an HTH DNA-binding domain [Microbacteriaceae bacterium]